MFNFPYTNFHELNLDWILNKVKEIVTKVVSLETTQSTLSADFTALEKRVTEELENLTVEPAVREVIDELRASGELQQMVETAVIALNRVPAGQGTASLFPASTEQLTGTYQQVQGGCVTPDGNIIYAVIPPEEAHYGNMNALWVKRSLNTFAKLSEAVITSGHTNSMGYNPADGYIYAACNPVIDESGTSISDNKYVVVNPADLTVIRRSAVVDAGGAAVTFHGITFDDEGVMYILQGEENVYKVDNDIATLEFILNEPMPKPLYSQDFSYYNGKFYHLYSFPNVVYVSAMDGTFVTSYNLPYWAGEYTYTGEAEFLSFRSSGEGYIGSFSFETAKRGVAALHIHRFSPTYNTFSQMVDVNAGVTQATTRNVYVDASYTGAFQNGSVDTPYTSLQQAINSFSNGNPYKNYGVYVKPGNYTYTYINDIPTSISINAESGVNIAGLSINACQYVYIDGATINAPSSGEYALHIVRSKAVVSNCTVNGTAAQTACIYVTYSELWTYQLTVDGAPVGLKTNASSVHGTVRGFTGEVANTYQLGGQTVWDSTQPRTHVLNSPDDQPFTFTGSVTLNPSAMRVKHKDAIYQTGVYQLPINPTNANALVFELIFKGKTHNRIMMIKSTGTMGLTETITEVVENVLYVGTIELLYNTQTGNMSYRSNKEFHNGETTIYSGDNSELDEDYIQVGNIYAVSI